MKLGKITSLSVELGSAAFLNYNLCYTLMVFPPSSAWLTARGLPKHFQANTSCFGHAASVGCWAARGTGGCSAMTSLECRRSLAALPARQGLEQKAFCVGQVGSETHWHNCGRPFSGQAPQHRRNCFKPLWRNICLCLKVVWKLMPCAVIKSGLPDLSVL